MHTAFSAIPLLHGFKEKPEAILVHGGKLFVGTASGNLAVFRIREHEAAPSPSSGAAAEDAATQPGVIAGASGTKTRVPVAEHLETHRGFSKRAVEKLGVIKEANLLVSLSDAHVSLHDITTMQLVSSLPQTRSALSFALDVSVQRQLSHAAGTVGADARHATRGGGARHTGQRGRTGPGGSLASSSAAPAWGGTLPNSTSSRAFRPSDPRITLRGRSSDAKSGSAAQQQQQQGAGGQDPKRAWQAVASLKGMDGLIREREERLQRAREVMLGTRLAATASSSNQQQHDVVEEEQGAVMTLVTTLAVGCRRRLVVFRWVDGAFWDTKEIALPHSPRALAFPTPTRLFLAYNATDLCLVTLDLAAESSVAEARASGVAEAVNATGAVPESSARGPTVNICEWATRELSVPVGLGVGGAGAPSSAALAGPGSGTSGGPGSTETAEGGSRGGGSGADGGVQASAAGAGASSAAPGGAAAAAVAAAGGLGAAFGGLGGYIGMGKTVKPTLVATDKAEVLLCKDNIGVFLDVDGKPARRDGIEWPATPEDTAFVRPYVFSVLPAGSSSTPFPTSNLPLLQVRSSSTLVPIQTIPFPPPASSGVIKALAAPSADKRRATPPTASKETRPTSPLPPPPPYAVSASSYSPLVHLMTPSAPPSKPPLYLAVVPQDRGALERQGATVWCLEMRSWGTQIDELVEGERFDEALGLLDSVDEVLLEDKPQRKARIEILRAVDLFARGRVDEAIDVFIERDVNPARVIALYPESVAGPLSRPREAWMELFGGRRRPSGDADEEAPRPEERAAEAGGRDAESSSRASVAPPPSPRRDAEPKANPASAAPATAAAAAPASVAAAGAVASEAQAAVPRERSRLTNLFGRRPQSFVGDPLASLGSSLASPLRKATVDDDARSIRSVRSTRTGEDEAASAQRKALDALGRFLADRRRIFKPILETWAESHTSLSQVARSPEWLLSLPSEVPLPTLERHELAAVAQATDTALFKTFLATKPALLGPLCRLENWCEVGQVEELLMERKRYSELIALYGGKEMHAKALALLRKFAEDESDLEEKVRPTISYLQNLGPEHIDLILETSHWVLRAEPQLGMEIFCADTGKVALLPHFAVVADLEAFDAGLCIQYLRFIIDDMGEGDPSLHDKLALLLLRQALDEPESETRAMTVTTLFEFLQRSHQYRAERLLARLPADDEQLYETRALLLGRMGQHEAALGIYVHRVADFEKAEEYCQRTWSQARTDADRNVFLTLLRIYLRPKPGGAEARAVQGAEGDTADPTGASPSAGATTASAQLMLEPALALISRHGAQVDATSAMELLPPLVPLRDVAEFARRALQHSAARRDQARVTAQLRRERDAQLASRVHRLHARRVKVGETRTCPRCLKRLGNSVVAVTTTGAVLHYSCR